MHAHHKCNARWNAIRKWTPTLNDQSWEWSFICQNGKLCYKLQCAHCMGRVWNGNGWKISNMKRIKQTCSSCWPNRNWDLTCARSHRRIFFPLISVFSGLILNSERWSRFPLIEIRAISNEKKHNLFIEHASEQCYTFSFDILLVFGVPSTHTQPRKWNKNA